MVDRAGRALPVGVEVRQRANILVWATWFGVFGLLEGLALTRRMPWTTFSEFTWSVERTGPIFRWGVLAIMVTLTSHLVGEKP